MKEARTIVFFAIILSMGAVAPFHRAASETMQNISNFSFISRPHNYSSFINNNEIDEAAELFFKGAVQHRGTQANKSEAIIPSPNTIIAIVQEGDSGTEALLASGVVETFILLTGTTKSAQWASIVTDAGDRIGITF